MCGEISQSTTAEIVEIANSADSESKLRDLMPVYFYSWQLRSPEAVITHLLLHYFILWRDCSDLRRDRQVFEEHIEWLKGRVGELGEVREPDPEIGRLAKQVQDLKMKNEKLQSTQDEVSKWAVCLSLGCSKARAHLNNLTIFIALQQLVTLTASYIPGSGVSVPTNEAFNPNTKYCELDSHMKIRSFAAAENLITVSRLGTCQTST